MERKPATPSAIDLVRFAMGYVDRKLIKFHEREQNFASEDEFAAAKERFRVRIIRELYQTFRSELRRFEGFYYEDLTVEEEKWPRKWMVRDQGIARMLRRTKFADLLNYIWSITGHAKTEELSQLIPEEARTVPETTGKGEEVVRQLILFTIDYRDAKKKLEMSTDLLRKYLREFGRLGIIRELAGGRGGGESRRPRIFAFGTWIRIPEKGSRRNPFLYDSPEWREKLRSFRLPR
jgi:hypothetical protein